ncbi:MAG: MoxR family ATPase [Polyangiales bacterium]
MIALTPPELQLLLRSLAPHRTAFVWGPPGVGKSAIVREAADALGLPCVTLLGTQLAPEDLIGVPRIQQLPATDGAGGAARFVTEFCPPRGVLRDTPYVLFVDELNSAVPDVQKAFYSLILDRRLGDYELPEGSRVVAAGNRIEDRALVRTMATALANRMVHVALEPTPGAWLAWGARAGVNPLVLAFVRTRPERLFETPPEDQTPAYPTPRSWHMLSDALVGVPDLLWPALAAGSVGDRAGAEFASFARRAREVPTIDDVASGKAAVPRDPELVYFLGAACLSALERTDAGAGEAIARTLIELAKVSKEIAVWALDAAFAREKQPPAFARFEAVLRAEGQAVLADVLRLGRFARE